MRLDCKQEFLEYRRNKIKTNTEKTVYQILSDVMEPMIESNHPRIKGALTALKGKRYYQSKDWIAAILSELGAIEYTSCTRLQNQNGRPRKSAIVSICIVLGINSEKSVELLGAAGHKFRNGNELDEAYSFLIWKSNQEVVSVNGGGRLDSYKLIDEYNQKLLDVVGEVKALDRLGPLSKEK